MAPILLHGTLHVMICNTTDGEGFSQSGQNTEDMKVSAAGKGVTTKLYYATIELERGRGGGVRISKGHINLRLNEPFHIYCAHKASEIVFTVKIDNSNGKPPTLIGSARIHVNDILDGRQIDRPVKKLSADDKRNRKPIHHVKLQFSDVTKGHNWNLGIASPDFPGVLHTYFSQQERCKVSLYQDAHVPDHFAPKILLSEGHTYQHQRCWEDMFDAINDAKHLIYITGWSVYTKISLLRDPSRPKSSSERATTLGELLIDKAKKGVTVLMLVWNDKTGWMDTRHKETTDYFNNTPVNCVSCSRQAKNGNTTNFLKNLATPWVFTHHQKTLVVDSELPGEKTDKRRIVSFVGGLDLCHGRYDTPFHSLFRTLSTVHHDDFYQPNFFRDAEVNRGGPREPWHDIHARLEGPIAWDVLTNFEKRWQKQGKKGVPLNDRRHIIPPSPVAFDNDHDTWNVQLFRSMDADAAPDVNKLISKTWKVDDVAAAKEKLVVSAKDNSIDHGIQDAYINAIRRARKFIYIENQYFIGSSFAWSDDHEDARSLHLIPKELSLKIVSKIKAGERFTVYVVVPMWPEGIPTSDPVQIILDGQRKTMEMMYKDIVEALNEKGIVDDDPRNYLTFFCLGNREVNRGEYQPPKRPKPNSHYMRAQEARRFMIYVHSKMMIVDDEYIIVGSANINQRSMDGARDSEIAMGGYQPHHINTNKVAARGQIHGFRMSLWYEHLRRLEGCFLHPESIECVKKVNQLADNNWDLYLSDSFESDLPGHLLRYPIGISPDGNVTELPGCKFFPDTEARVLGNLRGGSAKRKRYSDCNVSGFLQQKLAYQMALIFPSTLS